MFRFLRGHCHEYGLLADYCDVAMYKPHSLFSADSEIPPFEIMAYYDDVEVCNPLGCCAKRHKLGMTCLTRRSLEHCTSYADGAWLNELG